MKRAASSLGREAPKSKLNSLASDDTQGNCQPSRRLYASSFSIGARETQRNVTSFAFRWGTTPLTLSAMDEQTVQPAVQSGPNMKL
jgi:hypothetical protein